MKCFWIVLFCLRFVEPAVTQNVIPESPSSRGVSEQRCFKITENDVKALYNQYNEAVIGCDAVLVVALFWDRWEMLIFYNTPFISQICTSSFPLSAYNFNPCLTKSFIPQVGTYSNGFKFYSRHSKEKTWLLSKVSGITTGRNTHWRPCRLIRV